jgi:hypothetical protein
MTQYTRPELTAEELKLVDAKQLEASHALNKALTQRGIRGVITMAAVVINQLLTENARLTKEINEHRAARDIEPLPTFNR